MTKSGKSRNDEFETARIEREKSDRKEMSRVKRSKIRTYPPEINTYYAGCDEKSEDQTHQYSKERSQRERYRTIEFMRERLVEMHDKYHPQAIFVTQTSATLYGWTIKELWKKVWPNEKVPKIFTINIKPIIENHLGEKLTGKEDGFKEYISHLESFAETVRKGELSSLYDEVEFRNLTGPECWKRFPTNYDKVRAVLDQVRSPTYTVHSAIHQVINPNWSEFKNAKRKIEENLKKYHISGNVCVVDEGPVDFNEYLSTGKTLSIAEKVLNKVVKKKIGVIGLSRGHDTSFKKAKNGPWRRDEDNEKHRSVNYRRVNTPEERKKAQEMIEIYKQFGRELGEETIQERKKKKDLEQHLSAIIGAGGIIASLFFLSPKITGNVIGLSKTSSDLTGIFLFILGLTGLFVYIKLKSQLKSQNRDAQHPYML